MGRPGTLAYECQVSCVSVAFQVIVAFIFILSSLYAASLIMELLPLISSDLITTVPPGIRYATPRYQPSPPSPPPLSFGGGRRMLARFGER